MRSPLLKTGSELGDPTRSIWDTFQTYIIKNYAPTNCIQLHNPSWSQPIKWLIRSRTLIATRPRSWRTLGQTNMFHNNRLSEHVWMGQTLNFHHLSPVRDHELDMWWLHLLDAPPQLGHPNRISQAGGGPAYTGVTDRTQWISCECQHALSITRSKTVHYEPPPTSTSHRQNLDPAHPIPSMVFFKDFL